MIKVLIWKQLPLFALEVELLSFNYNNNDNLLILFNLLFFFCVEGYEIMSSCVWNIINYIVHKIS